MWINSLGFSQRPCGVFANFYFLTAGPSCVGFALSMNNKTLFQLSTAAAVIALGVGVWWFTRDKNPANQAIPTAESEMRREEGERIAKADADLAAKRREEG